MVQCVCCRQTTRSLQHHYYYRRQCFGLSHKHRPTSKCLVHLFQNSFLSFSFILIVYRVLEAFSLKGELNLDKKWQSDDLFYVIMNEIHPRFIQFCVILKLS